MTSHEPSAHDRTSSSGDDVELASAPLESGPLEVVAQPDGTIMLDTGLAGLPRITAAYLIPAARPTLVECGPARSIGSVLSHLDALGVDPDDLAHLVVSHIHLDHAGGAAPLLDAFPQATIVVSEVGAPHVAAPERLNASSRRVYGELFDPVYGDSPPVPSHRIRAVTDGDRVDLGDGRALEVLATPGHAAHHVAYLDVGTGALYAGDAVGVQLPSMRGVRPATPPPDFDLALALGSLRAMAARAPRMMYLAHYGPVDDPGAVLAEAAERLERWVATAAVAYAEHDETAHVAETLKARFQAELLRDPDDAEATRVLELLSSDTANAAGLIRYLKRRDEAATQKRR